MRISLILLVTCLCLSFDSKDNVLPFEPELFEDLPYVRDLAMTADGKEIFFTVDDPKHRTGFVVTAKRKRNKWSKPVIVSFSGRYRDIEPALTPDGLRLYFASNRPLEGSSDGEVKDYDIYYVQRKDLNSPWSHPFRLSSAINTEADEYYPSIVNDGSIYFTRMNEAAGTKEDIYVARLNGKEYNDGIPVSGSLNTEFYEFNAYVRPDESYMLFTSYRMRDGRGRNDLYISFRENDEWGPGQLIPEVYSDAIDYCPFITADEQTLFFTSDRSELVSSFDETQNLEDFLSYVKSTPNGSGRIYHLPWLDMKKGLWEQRTDQSEPQ